MVNNRSRPMFRAALARQEAPWKSSTADITSSIRGWDLSVSLTTLQSCGGRGREFSDRTWQEVAEAGHLRARFTSSLSEFTAVWTAKPSGWANGCTALAFHLHCPKAPGQCRHREAFPVSAPRLECRWDGSRLEGARFDASANPVSADLQLDILARARFATPFSESVREAVGSLQSLP